MVIKKIVDRELTEGEIASIERFRHYTDGVSFACLRERVMVMLHDEPEKDVEKLRLKTLERMDEALCVQPDFTSMMMDDGHCMVFLDTGIFAISEEVCEEEDMLLNLVLRGECLNACEEGEIIAVAYEEE